MTPEAAAELAELEAREKELFAEDNRKLATYRERGFDWSWMAYQRKLINGKIHRIWEKTSDIRESGLSTKQRKLVIKSPSRTLRETDRIYGATTRVYVVEMFGQTFEIHKHHLYGLRGSPTQYSVRPLKEVAQ